MKRFGLIVLALLFTSVVALADDADAARGLTARTFQFKYKEPDKAAAIIKSLLSAEGSMSIQPSTNALVVTDRSENLKAISSALAEYDAPARPVKVSLRLLAASRADKDSRVPNDLHDVAEKLSMLRFNSFESLGDAEIEGKEGEPGLIDLPSGYRAECRLGEFDPASDSIKLNDLRVSRFQGDKKEQLVQIYKATLNVKVGQTLLVGVAKPQGGRTLWVALVVKH